MIRNFFLYFFLIFTAFLSFTSTGSAQTALPDIQAYTQKGVNVLSWTCQYDGIKSIAVQRSSDSVYNFATIGYVKETKKGAQAFIDGHPEPGKNFYRLYIVFSSDLTWYSNRVKLTVDSAQLMQQAVLPPNDSLQKMVTTLSVSGSVPDPSDINAYTYVRSQYVFTNPFTGHVNIELPDSADKQILYSLKFFNTDNKMVLDIPKITIQSIVLDKRNFQKKGIYKFELRKNKSILETGYITIY